MSENPAHGSQHAQPESKQAQTAQQEAAATNEAGMDQVQQFKFLFSNEEVEKLKVLMPKFYSFISKDTLDKIKAGLMPKGRGGKFQRINFIEKKSVLMEQQLDKSQEPQQPVIYPDFSNVEFFKNQEPEIFAEVTTGERYFRQPQLSSTPKKPEPKPIPKKRQLSREQEIAQMTITKVFTPGVKLPNPSRYKESLKRQIYRQKREAEKRQKERQMKHISADKTVAQDKKLKVALPQSERESLSKLIDQFEKNGKSTTIFEAHTKPSMQFYWKMMKAKQKKMYTINAFEADLRRMFKIYYNTSGHPPLKIKQTKAYEEEIFITLRTTKKNLGIKSIEESKMDQPAPLARADASMPVTDSVSSRGRKRKNLFVDFTATKRPKRNKVSRQAERQYSILNRQILGKNIIRIPKECIQDFCLSYCLYSEEKVRQNSATFDFNLMRLGADTLFEMQKSVRNILAQHSLPYVQLSDDELSSQFVIEDSD